MPPLPFPSSPARSVAPAASWPEVVVVIPALNEAASLPLVLGELPSVGAVVVVDNGSSDETAAVARSLGAIVIAEPRRGYGQACQAGITWAAKQRPPPRVLVILDADHSDFPAELPLLVEPILVGAADIVLGSRVERAAPGSLLPHQRYGNALATLLIGAVTGQVYRDMGPFRAIRLSSLLDMGMIDPNYGWNVEMQMKAARMGLRIREVSVGYRPRVGVSKISGTVKGTLRAGSKILWSVWRYRR